MMRKKSTSMALGRKFSSLFALKEFAVKEKGDGVSYRISKENRPPEPKSEIQLFGQKIETEAKPEVIPLYTIFVDNVIEQSLAENTELLKVSETIS